MGRAADIRMMRRGREALAVSNGAFDVAGLSRIADLDLLPDVQTATSAMVTLHSGTDEPRVVFMCGERPSSTELRAIFDWSEACCQSYADDRRRSSRSFRAELTVGDQLHDAVCLILPHMGDSRAVATALYRGYPANRAPGRHFSTPLHPAIETYFSLWRKKSESSAQMAGLVSALNFINFGICLLDSERNIKFLNRAAERILAAEDGLRRTGRTISAVEVADSVKLQVAVSHVWASQIGGEKVAGARRVPVLALRRPNARRPLATAVLPLEPVDGAEPGIILCFCAPDQDLTSLLRPILKLYGLSPVEGRLVGHIAAGRTLAEAARVMRIKEQTARAYLKQIFQKTDTNRQAELVRVMLSSLIHASAEFEHELL